MIKVTVLGLLEKWAKEKGFFTYSPPPLKAYVNIALTATDAEYVTAWFEGNKIKFLWQGDTRKRKACFKQKELLPADPELFAKIEEILACLTPKK